VKIARPAEELYEHSVKDDNGEEVDEFRRMREEWHKEDRERRRTKFKRRKHAVVLIIL